MKVKILKGTVGDKKILKKDDVVDLSEKCAKFLISINKAKAVSGDDEEKENPASKKSQEKSVNNQKSKDKGAL